MAGRTMAFSHDDRVDQAIRDRQGPGASRSKVLRDMVAAYLEMVSRCRPALEASEWGFLLEAIPAAADLGARDVAGLGGMVKRRLDPGDPLRRWGVDPDMLGDKISRMDYGAQAAIADQLRVEQASRGGRK